MESIRSFPVQNGTGNLRVVDLLVVMNHDKKRDVEQEIEIDRTLPRQFPLDILVRRPEEVSRRLASHDMALVTIFKTGVPLYERSRNYA
ncbi:MAG: hypothetical protein PHG71_04190 [Kiritimatiellae bacterium]|nr:hypothetical protein [Kiritimatiellia bacterium]MDD4622419.1 hypothetical protein [Kiritimatiellia bacterium]